MDDDESYKLVNISKKDGKKTINIKRFSINVGTFFQSIWVRCRTIFSDIMDREFMVRKFYFVLYCGSIFWILHLFYQIIK